MQIIAGVFRLTVLWRERESQGDRDFCGRESGGEARVKGVVLRSP